MRAVLPLPRPILLFHVKRRSTRGSIQCSSNYMQRRTTTHILSLYERSKDLTYVTHDENLIGIYYKTNLASPKLVFL